MSESSDPVGSLERSHSDAPPAIPDAAPCAGLALEGIHKTYGTTLALDGVSLCVPGGSIVAVLGPSGSGKSTLLSIIAGLELPDAGRVLWEGESLEGVPAHRRGFGLMFQDFALFPHLSVERNVGFGLRMQNQEAGRIGERVRECLEQVGLAGFERRDVQTLSGGEQQRVALARALAPRPRLLMLDEPLGALDRTLRERLLGEIHRILRAARQTALVVTHDQEEAFGLADRIVILDAGRVVQEGEPQAVFHHPASASVAGFLGLTNLVGGEAAPGGIQTALGLLPLEAPSPGRCTVLLRPDAARLDGQGPLVLETTLLERTFRGPTCILGVQAHGVHLKFEVPSAATLPPEGSPLRMSLDPRAFQVFP
jgi:ABC-type Fe3+/spermidine/putrescine transport system ATPase subunit